MIWGTVQKVTSIATSSGDGACLGFAIGNDELEVARDQFGCAVGPPPIAVEFNEREEDVSSDPPVEDGGDDVSEAPVGVGQLPVCGTALWAPSSGAPRLPIFERPREVRARG